MTDQATPQGGEAQPIADANSIDSIIDNAVVDSKEPPQADEPSAVEPKPDEPFPKKAINALSYRDKKIGKLQAELAAERAAKQALEQQYKPQQKPTGEPQEKDFTNFADFIDAKNAYRIEQGFAKYEGKQQESRQSQQEQAWVAQREQVVATTAQQFIKENPEAQAIVEEYAPLADEFSPELQRLFLEADNAPLAFFNLAKEGKLEALMEMSPARAAMEIGRAQTQAPTKPKTKAPTPLPASRGSVPSGKSLDTMSGHELLKWVDSKG